MVDVTIVIIPYNIEDTTLEINEYVSKNINIYNYVQCNLIYMFKIDYLKIYNYDFRLIKKKDIFNNISKNNKCTIFVSKNKSPIINITAKLLYNNKDYSFNYIFPIFLYTKNDKKLTYSIIDDLLQYFDLKCNSLVSKKSNEYLKILKKNIDYNTLINKKLLNIFKKQSNKFILHINLYYEKLICNTNNEKKKNNNIKNELNLFNNLFQLEVDRIKKQILDPNINITYNDYKFNNI